MMSEPNTVPIPAPEKLNSQLVYSYYPHNVLFHIQGYINFQILFFKLIQFYFDFHYAYLCVNASEEIIV